MKEKGFVPLFIILGVVILISVVGGGGFYLWQGYNSEKTALQSQIQENDKQKALIQEDLSSKAKKISDLEVSQASAEAAKQKAELEKQEVEKKVCKGVWKNGICVKSTCVDSDVNEKPDDIYIKGNVTFTNQNGVETTVYDECSGSKLQLNEMWCYESPSGSRNYVQGKGVANCGKGCLDGACIK